MRKVFLLFIIFCFSCILSITINANENSGDNDVDKLIEKILSDGGYTNIIPSDDRVTNPNPEVFKVDNKNVCSNGDYSLDRLVGTSFQNIGCYTNLSDATTAMKKDKGNDKVVRYKNSYSYSQIIAANKAYAVSAVKYTLDLYKTADLNGSQLSFWSTYVGDGYKFYYLDTVVNSKNQIVYKVNLNGYVGYVDSKYVDLIPTKYIVEDTNFTIRYNGQLTKFNKTDTNTYVVKRSNEGYNELYYTVSTMEGNYSIGPYAIAPSYLKPGYYFSHDGISFYSDPYLENLVSEVKFYNYFQFLPLRSYSKLDGNQLKKYLNDKSKTNSVYYNHTNSFVNYQQRYGMNALLVFSMANHESAYGTSNYAVNRNNLFGWDAIDSNPGNAKTFSSVDESIRQHMGRNLFGYSNVNDWRFSGPALGNKGAGFTTKYASDPDWGLKIAAHAYQTDKLNGFVDYQKYGIGLIKDYSDVNVRKSPNSNSKVLYNSFGATKKLINQTVAIIGETGDYYQIVPWYPMVNEDVLLNHQDGNYTTDKNNVAYISKQYVNIINNSQFKPDKVVVDDKKDSSNNNGNQHKLINPIKYKVNDNVTGLNIRQMPGTNYSIVGRYVGGQTFEGEKANNGWVKIIYNNQFAYISADFVTAISNSNNQNNNTLKNKVGDINQDGKTSVLDLVLIQKHVVKSKLLSDQQIKLADMNHDGKISVIDYVMLVKVIMK